MVVGNRSGFCRYLLSKPKYQPTTDTLIIRTSLKFVISPDFGGNLSFPEMSYFLPLCENTLIFIYVMAILKNTRVPQFRILAVTCNQAYVHRFWSYMHIAGE